MTDRYNKSNLLLNKALQSIPLASQTFSKSFLQFPQGVSPLFISHGKGSKVWDVDGNEYIDFINALLSVSIGYSDDDINQAVIKQLNNGVSFSLPHPLEMQVAELLIELIPCAEKVRFGKNGTDATSAAVRLARAYTGRDHILVCGYHGWQDWYIGSTSRDLGIPDSTKSLTHSFEYNNFSSIEEHFMSLSGKVAAVILEPMNIAWPENDFLEKVAEITRKNKAVLIFDETITGCRFSKGGAQELFNVKPDLATFGKGISNGFPLSAIVGKSEIMDLMEDIFVSGTFGGETISLAAAQVVLEKVKNTDFIDHIYSIGKSILGGVEALIKKHKLESCMVLSGHPSWSIFIFKDIDSYASQELKTYFLQEIFKRGVLTIGSHNISYSHTEKDVDYLLSVYDEVFLNLSNALVEKNLYEKIDAKILEPVFKVR